jgi:hypothetical protein
MIAFERVGRNWVITAIDSPPDLGAGMIGPNSTSQGVDFRGIRRYFPIDTRSCTMLPGDTSIRLEVLTPQRHGSEFRSFFLRSLQHLAYKRITDMVLFSLIDE